MLYDMKNNDVTKKIENKFFGEVLSEMMALGLDLWETGPVTLLDLTVEQIEFYLETLAQLEPGKTLSVRLYLTNNTYGFQNRMHTEMHYGEIRITFLEFNQTPQFGRTPADKIYG